MASDLSIGDFRYVTAVVYGDVAGQPRAVTGGNDATVRIWDPLTCRQVGSSLVGHTEPVTAVRLLTTGDRTAIVSASEDATVRLWDAQTGRQFAMFASDSPLESCTVSPDGRTIVAGCRSGTMHFLTLKD